MIIIRYKVKFGKNMVLDYSFETKPFCGNLKEIDKDLRFALRTLETAEPLKSILRTLGVYKMPKPNIKRM